MQELAQCHGYRCRMSEAQKGRPAVFRWQRRMLEVTATRHGVTVWGQSGLLTPRELGELVEVLGEACATYEHLAAHSDRGQAADAVDVVREVLSDLDAV